MIGFAVVGAVVTIEGVGVALGAQADHRTCFAIAAKWSNSFDYSIG